MLKITYVGSSLHIVQRYPSPRQITVVRLWDGVICVYHAGTNRMLPKSWYIE